MKYKKEIKSSKQREITYFKVSLKDKHVLFAMSTIEHKISRQSNKENL